MRTTNALLLLLSLAFPAVALPHPCEEEVAQMRKELESIRKAIATIEGVPQSDLQAQMLAGAKGKLEREQRRTSEAEARCEKLVQAGNPVGTPAPAVAAPAAPAPAAPSPAPAPATAPAVVATVAAPTPPATPAPAVIPAPAAITVPPAAPAAVPAAAPSEVQTLPVTPCLTGCGKDTDCKGDRICVKGECVEPPARKSPSH